MENKRIVRVQIDTENSVSTFMIEVPAEEREEQHVHRVLGGALVMGVCLLDGAYSVEGAARAEAKGDDDDGYVE